MNARFNRRRFLVATGTSAGLLILGHRTSVRGYVANEKLDIAAVGAGGRGAANLADLESENIVALCDVDLRRAAPAFAKYASAKKYHDYRLLFQEMASEIDAVVVSAPNHVHVPASVTAMYLDKHVYCEKPLAHSMHEARWAARVAAERKLATQMGTQIHASENFRRIVELVQAGAIGTVDECHCWLKGGGSAGDRPVETPPVPPELHWDLWLAVAPFRPYHPCYVPHDWHYWWDFGGGEFGNMGCHYFDLMFWALDLRHPVSIEAMGPTPHAESTPAWQHVRYQFPMRGDRPAVTLTWTHGRAAPEIFAQNNVPDWAWGVLVGDNGLLAVNYNQRMLLPQAAFADYQPPQPSIPPSAGHHREWIVACKTGSPTLCNFDYSGAVTEAVLLGNIAYRTGEILEWDADAFRITNVPAANDYLRREYRKGWEVPVTG
ncbi:MAG: Gfo/Idh/MocA family oxidoreductase [Planctomycetes bacterium]|nr:Gfo/Idh/MocA family oxidoreductase [Planctomycetota bacterium]